MSERYHAFPQLIGDQPKILILGTFPSPISREKGEYYGNAQNKFWNIIFDVFGVKFDNPDYTEKQKVLFDNGIALWDVIESCEIIGALDSAIKKPLYNTALPEFIKSNDISTVVFNGQKAYAFYKKGIGDSDGIVLPSTSPANAGMSYDAKLSAWEKALKPMEGLL